MMVIQVIFVVIGDFNLSGELFIQIRVIVLVAWWAYSW
jgi:hypothetical protein